MLPESVIYQSQISLGSANAVKVYYDFSPDSVFSAQSGAVHNAYLRNLSISNSGFFPAKIVNATGVSSAAAISEATGIGKFLEKSVGDFTKAHLHISGSSEIDLDSCSYLMLVDSNLKNDGVIMGSFERTSGVAQGETIISSKGFNLGMNSRGKIFFQSLNSDGDYCFTFDDSELSRKNVIGLNFSPSQIGVFRFDYLNEEIQSNFFPIQTTHIKDTASFMIGDSPQYWRDHSVSLYSGKIEAFAILSGTVSAFNLFSIGKSLVQDYSYNSGSVTESNVLSGYIQQINYKTGVTGQYANITGYLSVISGIDNLSQVINTTGVLQVKEGDRYYKNFGDYIEQVGFLSDTNVNSYSPSGEAAHATLGLKSGFFNVSGIVTTGSQVYTTINLPLYEIIYLTGLTNEVSSITNTPVYQNFSVTGQSSSGLSYTGLSDGFKKDYIYYMGDRGFI
jgi:hypothetical protein